MYARVTTTQVSPDKIEEAVLLWRDSVMPAAKQQKGFRSGRLMVDRKIGKAVSVGLWEIDSVRNNRQDRRGLLNHLKSSVNSADRVGL